MNSYVYPGLKIPYRSQIIKSFYIDQEDKAKEITRIVCNFFDIDPKDIFNQCRKRELVVARQLSMFFIKDKTTLSLKVIGKLFDGRDHSTVIYAITTVNDLIDTDKRFAATVIAVSKLLEHIKLKDENHTDLPTVGSN